jgi:Ion channel
VPDIPRLLERIPDDIKPMTALGIGAFLLVCTVLFHGAGLHRVLILHRRGERRLLSGRPHLLGAALLFAFSVFLMLTLHVIEIMIFALVLTRLGLVVRAADAIYFCANAYTTLGYGNVDLGPYWRNISPVIAMAGLFTFAWTTSALVDVVSVHGQLVEKLENERVLEKELRSALRKDEWNVLQHEREAARVEREKTRDLAVGASFFQRRRIWKEEREKETQLIKDKVAEIRDLRRKEHQAEEELGPGGPPPV